MVLPDMVVVCYRAINWFGTNVCRVMFTLDPNIRFRLHSFAIMNSAGLGVGCLQLSVSLAHSVVSNAVLGVYPFLGPRSVVAHGSICIAPRCT